MVELAAASGIGAAGSELTQSRKTIAENFDTFLSILTTQLKNQNPLEPLDTNQFTSQMVEFTSVEQQLKTNEYLEALIKANEGAFASQAVSYIGKAVTAFGSSAQLDNSGNANWTYGLTRNAPESTITIRDGRGAAVFSKELALNQGEHNFSWDGRNNDGARVPAGEYSLHIEARTADGQNVQSYTMTKGIVDTVDFAGPEPILVINGNRIALSDVAKVGLAG